MLKLLDRVLGIEGITWSEVLMGLALAFAFWFALVVFLSI
jgi:hypothetical protein